MVTTGAKACRGHRSGHAINDAAAHSMNYVTASTAGLGDDHQEGMPMDGVETLSGASERQAASGSLGLVAALLGGAAVAVFVGVYGRAHDPTGQTLTTLFFSRQITMKVWLATLAVLSVVFQIGSALWMYGKVGARKTPSWLGDLHRISGTVAFIVSLPVAYHCLWAIGFSADLGVTRVFVHSLAGCLFYGAFAAKVIVVRSPKLPALALPIAGSLVFTTLVTLWLTSAFWFFNTQGLRW